MAGKTNLSIDGLRTIAHGHKYRAMIAVGVREDGTVDVVSYGKSKDDCRVIGDYAQNQFGKSIPRVPFQSWFGWGNGGVAVKVRDIRLQQDPKLAAYVAANTHPDAVDA